VLVQKRVRNVRAICTNVESNAVVWTKSLLFTFFDGILEDFNFLWAKRTLIYVNDRTARHLGNGRSANGTNAKEKAGYCMCVTNMRNLIKTPGCAAVEQYCNQGVENGVFRNACLYRFLPR
jgi:hypothetical protein